MAEIVDDFVTPPLPLSMSTDFDVSYYSFGDRLIVSFCDAPSPGMNVSIGDGSIELRVTHEEDQLLGFEIPNFVHVFLPEHPEFLTFAESAGVSAETIDHIRSSTSIRDQQSSAIRSIVRQFAGLDIPR
jgi:hypothetical protein